MRTGYTLPVRLRGLGSVMSSRILNNLLTIYFTQLHRMHWPQKILPTLAQMPDVFSMTASFHLRCLSFRQFGPLWTLQLSPETQRCIVTAKPDETKRNRTKLAKIFWFWQIIHSPCGVSREWGVVLYGAYAADINLERCCGWLFHQMGRKRVPVSYGSNRKRVAECLC